MKSFSEIYNEWHHLDKVDLARKVYEECQIDKGFVVVPKEPTLKVLDKLFAEHDLDEDRAGYIYKDMIEAAQEELIWN